MKRIALILTILALVAALGCQAKKGAESPLAATPTPVATPTASPLAGYQIYTDTENGFSIAVPQGWEKMPTSGFILAAFFGPPEGGLAPNANIVKEVLPFALTAQEFANLGEAGLKLFTGYQSLSLSSLTLSGLPAMKRVYTLQSPEPQKIKINVVQVHLVKDTAAWVITCGASESMYEKYGPICDKIVDSFQLMR